MAGCDEVRKGWSMVWPGVGLPGTSADREGHGTAWPGHGVVGEDLGGAREGESSNLVLVN